MSTRVFWVVVAAVLASAAGVGGGRVLAQPATPEGVVAAYIDALNAGDADAATALAAADIVDDSFACAATYGRPCSGIEEFGTMMAAAVASNASITPIGGTAEGNIVSVKLELRFDDLAAFPGVRRLVQTNEFEIVNSLIARETITPDFSDAQTAAFFSAISALASQDAPSPAETGHGVLSQASPGKSHLHVVAFAVLVLIVGARLVAGRREGSTLRRA